VSGLEEFINKTIMHFIVGCQNEFSILKFIFYIYGKEKLKKSSLIDEATFSYRILDAETVIFLMN
jgi:hypothetical protein